jgi:hypothetical protein
MNTFDKNMEKIFDVMPTEQKTEILPALTENQSVSNSDLKEDLADAYQQSKDNLQDIIDQGKEAMNEILEIAKAGQHPRAFEVYGTLLKNMVDANKELLNIQKQMRDMDKSNKKEGDTKIDKAIFVGSSADLNKLLKGNKE